VLIAWTAFICSAVPTMWWFIQMRSMAASSRFWSAALACLITTVVAWVVGVYAIRQYLLSRDRTRAMMADLRDAIRRQGPVS